MSVQLNINDGHAITLDELLDVLPRSKAAKEVALLRMECDVLAELVDHVLLQYDRYHAGEALAGDGDAFEWEKRARAVRGAKK